MSHTDCTFDAGPLVSAFATPGHLDAVWPLPAVPLPRVTSTEVHAPWHVGAVVALNDRRSRVYFWVYPVLFCFVLFSLQLCDSL